MRVLLYGVGLSFSAGFTPTTGRVGSCRRSFHPLIAWQLESIRPFVTKCVLLHASTSSEEEPPSKRSGREAVRNLLDEQGIQMDEAQVFGEGVDDMVNTHPHLRFELVRAPCRELTSAVY